MFKRWLIIFSALTILMFSLAGCKSGEFDVIVKNGTIVDGSGNSAYKADLGIKGDTIAEIGDLSGRTASKTIDAKGLAVSPGFQ
jgi:N-acyl-D-aspartate/D-glutamate deacylase